MRSKHFQRTMGIIRFVASNQISNSSERNYLKNIADNVGTTYFSLNTHLEFLKKIGVVKVVRSGPKNRKIVRLESSVLENVKGS